MPKSIRAKPAPSVGQSIPRVDGREKVLGEARYIDDLVWPDMIFGRTVRSTVAKGRILSVTLDPAFDWNGFTVVDHRDIPPGGRNLVSLFADDQPLLAVDRVNHREEPILLLAHADRGRLDEAMAHVRVEYQAEEPTFELERASEVLKEVRIAKGDLEAGFAQAEIVVEGTYRTGAQEQLYIEPNGVVAIPGVAGDPRGVTLYGSLQCPYFVVNALRVVFGLEEKQVRVVQATTGGAFGGKEEYPSMLAGHAALLACKAGRPVKMVYDRHEDMTATTKRHPSWVRIRTGLLRDGTIVAEDIDFRLDGGAYVTISPVVLSRGAIHAGGPYRIPNIRIVGRAFKTNTPPNGAFRGFGAPQSQFAKEVHMDRIAERVGIDAVELRRKNLLRAGDATATGQVLRASADLERVLDRALARHGRGRKRKPTEGKLTGSGLALFWHGAGFTGGGEDRLASRVGLELLPGGVRILVSTTEMGQGSRTTHSQIVADTLEIPVDWVDSFDPDTSRVPNSGPTVASRTCMIVGGLLAAAAEKMKLTLGAWRTPEEFCRRARARLGQEGPLTVFEQYRRASGSSWNEETYEGDAYGAYAWGCNLADVEVDAVTFEVRCTRMTTVVDVGRAIHPVIVEGQIEGGTLQAIGWALYEDVVMRDGRMANGHFTDYIIPTTLDCPHIEVELIEDPYGGGPFGAKGIGECPMDGPAAALVNAIRRATGARLDAIPATPERVMQALGDATQGGGRP